LEAESWPCTKRFELAHLAVGVGNANASNGHSGPEWQRGVPKNIKKSNDNTQLYKNKNK